MPFLKPYKGRFVQAGVAMCLVAALNGGAVYLLKPIVDRVFISRDFRILWLAVALVPLLVFLKTVAAYIQNYLMSWIGQSVTQELREELFRRLHQLSLDFFVQRKSGEVLSRVTNDLTLLQSCLHFIPLYLVRDSATVVVLLGVLFYLHWKFALLALLSVPMVAALLWIFGRKMRDASARSQQVMGQIYHRFQESLQGMVVIKAFNYEEGAIRRFQLENRSFFDEIMRYLRATALSGPLMEFAGSLVLALLIYYGGKEIIAERLTPGEFFAFLGSFFAAYAPVKNLARANSTLQMGLASADRIFQLLDEKTTVMDAPRAPLFEDLKSGLSLRGVSFRYPTRETLALKDVSFSIAKGEIVAVVGPSGSGKSTLAQLLLRLYDPTAGEILVDGRDLKLWNSRSLRARIGLVSQDTVLFNDTILHNVALGLEPAALDRVRDACRIAHIDDFIETLPQGYETLVGDRGLSLSGGQRQRIAIARAILKDPSILILDEATSNLDGESEAIVQKALEGLMQGRTVVVIAHRLSTVRNADRLFVFNEGELAEEGTHGELIARNGLYQKLYEVQSREAPSQSRELKV
ncbi:MAG: ABC transporter ATP-binding protein [Elusimicrobia bacterium]|nr:ABC transporter ATP-binding protein [Elusimicrobiota bacterium]